MSSAAAKAFNGWRPILAPARAAFSSAASAPTKKKAKEPIAKSSPFVVRRGIYQSLWRPRRVSPALANFTELTHLSVMTAHSAIYNHIMAYRLENPQDEREFFCDEKLKTILDGKNVVKYRELGKFVSRHFV